MIASPLAIPRSAVALGTPSYYPDLDASLQDELATFVHRPQNHLLCVQHGVNERVLLTFLDGFIDALRKVAHEVHSTCAASHNAHQSAKAVAAFHVKPPLPG